MPSILCLRPTARHISSLATSSCSMNARLPQASARNSGSRRTLNCVQTTSCPASRNAFAVCKPDEAEAAGNEDGHEVTCQ